VSDDLSIEQLMRCNDAERILAKRREALEIAAAAAGPKKSASSSAAAPASSASGPDDSLDVTARSTRLLLFVRVSFAKQQLRFFVLVFCVPQWHPALNYVAGHHGTSA
jgi:hypothetical protein